MKRIVIASILTLAASFMLIAAASCGDDAAVPIANSGSDSAVDSPSPPADASLDSEARACRPAVPEPRPAWVPSRPFHDPVCTAAEVDAFFATCVAGDEAACAKFVASNPKCAACAYSDNTDLTYGPMIGHRKENYRYPNFGGCVGNRLAQPDAGGCGEAASLYDQCRYRACHRCFPIVNQDDLEAFGKCRDSAEGSTYCAAEASRYASRCYGEFASNNPDGAIAFCARLPSDQAFVRLWCTADPSSDGGSDASDGG